MFSLFWLTELYEKQTIAAECNKNAKRKHEKNVCIGSLQWVTRGDALYGINSALEYSVCFHVKLTRT